jgi:hypothetical protein
MPIISGQDPVDAVLIEMGLAGRVPEPSKMVVPNEVWDYAE